MPPEMEVQFVNSKGDWFLDVKTGHGIVCVAFHLQFIIIIINCQYNCSRVFHVSERHLGEIKIVGKQNRETLERLHE